jgi:hypothetical protein
MEVIAHLIILKVVDYINRKAIKSDVHVNISLFIFNLKFKLYTFILTFLRST